MKNFTDLEEGFLRFLKEKMGVTGVKLYQIDNNGNVKTIELNSDGTKNKKDC